MRSTAFSVALPGFAVSDRQRPKNSEGGVAPPSLGIMVAFVPGLLA
jgi:hypothetical protein